MPPFNPDEIPNEKGSESNLDPESKKNETSPTDGGGKNSPITPEKTNKPKVEVDNDSGKDPLDVSQSLNFDNIFLADDDTSSRKQNERNRTEAREKATESKKEQKYRFRETHTEARDFYQGNNTVNNYFSSDGEKIGIRKLLNPLDSWGVKETQYFTDKRWIAEKTNILEEERIIMIRCISSRVGRAASLQLITRLKQQNASLQVQEMVLHEKIERPGFYSTFEPEEVQEGSDFVLSILLNSPSIFDTFFSADIGNAGFRKRFSQKNAYLICILTDEGYYDWQSEKFQSKRTNLSITCAEIDYLPHLLSAFYDQAEALRIEIELKYKDQRLIRKDEEAVHAYHELLIDLLASNGPEVLVNQLKDQKGLELLRQDKTQETNQKIKEGGNLYKGVLFAALYFPNLNFSDFQLLVEDLLTCVQSARTNAKDNPDLLEKWAWEGDEIMEELQLGVGEKVEFPEGVDFEEEELRLQYMTYFSKRAKGFGNRLILCLKDKNYLFHHSRSLRLQFYELIAEMAKASPEKYGTEVLKELFRDAYEADSQINIQLANFENQLQILSKEKREIEQEIAKIIRSGNGQDQAVRYYGRKIKDLSDQEQKIIQAKVELSSQLSKRTKLQINKQKNVSTHNYVIGQLVKHMLIYESLTKSVHEAFNYAIDRTYYLELAYVVQQVSHLSNLDALYWMRQLIERGNTKARNKATNLLHQLLAQDQVLFHTRVDQMLGWISSGKQMGPSAKIGAKAILDAAQYSIRAFPLDCYGEKAERYLFWHVFESEELLVQILRLWLSEHSSVWITHQEIMVIVYHLLIRINDMNEEQENLMVGIFNLLIQETGSEDEITIEIAVAEIVEAWYNILCSWVEQTQENTQLPMNIVSALMKEVNREQQEIILDHWADKPQIYTELMLVLMDHFVQNTEIEQYIHLLRNKRNQVRNLLALARDLRE